MVLSVVFRQRICHAVQSEGRSADAVAHPAHRRTEEAVVSLILRQGVIAQHHIHAAEYQPPQRCAVSKYFRCQKLIFQRPAFHGLAERCYAESLTHLPHLCCLLSTGTFQLFALSIVCILPKSKGSDVHKASRTLALPLTPIGSFPSQNDLAVCAAFLPQPKPPVFRSPPSSPEAPPNAPFK